MKGNYNIKPGKSYVIIKGNLKEEKIVSFACYIAGPRPASAELPKIDWENKRIKWAELIKTSKNF